MSFHRASSFFNRRIAFDQFSHGFKYWTFTFASWVPAVIFFNGNIGDFTWINGESMYPYLNTNFNGSLAKDVCWVNKRNPTKDLRRGMIVSFRSPTNPETRAIKRVIALEGDMVFTRAPYPLPTVRIPVNHVWVEGDNSSRNKSLDSNSYGPISMSLIEGRVTHVLSPKESRGEIRWWEFRGKTRVIKGKKEDAPRWD